MTAPSQSFSPTNLKSNRFLENYFDTPVLDLGDVQGTLFLDLTTSTKFKFNVIGNLTITYSDQGNVNDKLELWVLNEGYTITWPSTFSLSSSTTSTQILTYFELRRVGSVWSSINYKSFTANPYVALIPCPCVCASSTASSYNLCPPHCSDANAFKNAGASYCCLSSCVTCCCIAPASISTAMCCQGNGGQSFNSTYIHLGKVLNGFTSLNCWIYFACCTCNLYGLGYYRPSAGNYIPFGYCVCTYYYTCWDGGAYRHGVECCTWPLGFDDNGVYYLATSHRYCYTYNSAGTTCHTFTIQANCIQSVTGAGISVPAFYYCVYCQCQISACCDGSNYANACFGNAFQTYLRWLSPTQGMVVGFAGPCQFTDCDFNRTTLHFKCTGSYSYCSSTSNDVILSKAHSVPYFVSLCCIIQQQTNNYFGQSIYWRILWDCNWESSTAAPNMCVALNIIHNPCINSSSGLSYYCEPPIVTGDGCYVISVRVPLMCVGTGWWCGSSGCCTTNCGVVEVYCRCANSCFFCTTPCVFVSSYTDTSNFKYVGKLRCCCINPWIDGQRGKNWWIENVEVVCRVSGTFSCYAICFNSSAGCWEVSSLSYSCICQLNGYDWFCSNQRPNGSVPHLPYGPCLDSNGFGFQSLIFGCANQVPMCCCTTYCNTTAGGYLKTNWNFSPNEISPATNLASSSITERSYTGRPYLEKFRG